MKISKRLIQIANKLNVVPRFLSTEEVLCEVGKFYWDIQNDRAFLVLSINRNKAQVRWDNLECGYINTHLNPMYFYELCPTEIDFSKLNEDEIFNSRKAFSGIEVAYLCKSGCLSGITSAKIWSNYVDSTMPIDPNRRYYVRKRSWGDTYMVYLVNVDKKIKSVTKRGNR